MRVNEDCVWKGTARYVVPCFSWDTQISEYTFNHKNLSILTEKQSSLILPNAVVLTHAASCLSPTTGADVCTLIENVKTNENDKPLDDIKILSVDVE
jgi:hypothetical protein